MIAKTIKALVFTAKNCRTSRSVDGDGLVASDEVRPEGGRDLVMEAFWCDADGLFTFTAFRRTHCRSIWSRISSRGRGSHCRPSPRAHLEHSRSRFSMVKGVK